MKAMIMAAGKGTRMGSISETIPKALLEINGKSLLRIAVENCNTFGFNDIVINVHHLADQMIAEVMKLRTDGFSISISDERDQLLETGGGLFRARDFFDDKPFLLCNADTITDLDLRRLYEYHLERNGLATLAVRHRKGNRHFLIDDSGRLRGWSNKTTGERIVTFDEDLNVSEISFSGRHIIDPSIFRYMSEGVYTMTALYLTLAADHEIFSLTEDSGYWITVGNQEELEEARRFFSTVSLP
jgi:NDP-sugar pyrophosphorylase family protein